ncbi:MAG TPA: CHAD domain-containing protein, partial [Longilinea sp.]|nr:CHAD domain-containing protein [Longilinea sp.]
MGIEDNLDQSPLSSEHPVESTPLDAVFAFGATAILKHTQSMAAEIEGVRLGQDPEAIHRMRVASRRLRTTLQLFPECLPAHRSDDWYKAIRKAASVLGHSRDLDVQVIALEELIKTITDRSVRPGVIRIALRTRQHRLRTQADIHKCLNALKKSHALESIEKKINSVIGQETLEVTRDPALFLMASQSCAGLLAEFLMYKEYIHRPECITELHQMRITAKHLRYTLETFSELYAERISPYLQAIRTAQTLLGDIHDCDVWSLLLPKLIEKETEQTLAYYGTSQPIRRLRPGFDWFLENRNSFRAETYASFVKKWDAWEAKGFWPALLGVLTQ